MDLINELHSLLDQVETRKAPLFRKKLYALKRAKRFDDLSYLQNEIEESLKKVTEIKSHFPSFEYDEALPIVSAKDEIIEALKNHQVIVVCGETGSGKTTQLAKFCLELGIGAKGIIGHTQPRRIAARSVATRIAEELHTEIGGFVGYKMRFNDTTAHNTRIKLMTDGVLLSELKSDPYLNQYEAIIIDEAHERSLNIDFLLGILKKITEKRKDLKIIITSATIDPARFAKFFSQHNQNVPIIEVSGRTYPVEVRYRPLVKDDENDEDLALTEGISLAVDELYKEARGDILVFLSGEREIREVGEFLEKNYSRSYDILPLFSRLSNAEQNKIFAPHQKMRIVLATNVAETSLTVPGIKYVIDAGTARVSRYSARSRLQRLLVEPISKASANQRKGRCGRVSEGICIRLYSEDDFNMRSEFLDPEILRTNLASVILQMAHLRLGLPEAFDFIEKPELRQIKEGYATLKELKAIDDHNQLLPLGKKIAELPIDPRFAAMIFEGIERGVMHEMIILVALLSIQSPFERPLDKQQAADEKHRVFKQANSDFIGFINLWIWYQTQKKVLSNNQLKTLCKKHFIGFLRMREWHDLYQQIKNALKNHHSKLNELPELTAQLATDQIHQSLLVGLLDRVGEKDEEGFYKGTLQQKFKIFPGSAIFKKQPKWLMAMEIVETSQVYARICAEILPEWLEIGAKHLLKKRYSEPHWSKKQGQASAYETVMLFNLAIIKNRLVSFGKIDPQISRELLIKEGLVQDDIYIRAAFYKHNKALIESIEKMEDKTRRRDILAEEYVLYEWYDKRIPKDCYSVQKLEKWTHNKDNDASLWLSEKDILQNDDALDLDDYPETVYTNGLTLNALYLFDPSDKSDGMTILVPLAALNLLTQNRLDWLCKGLIEDKIIGLIRSLPKALRRLFVPIPEFSQLLVKNLPFAENNLFDALSQTIFSLKGIKIEPHLFDDKTLDKHLLMNIRILDAGGKTVGEGRDLTALKEVFSLKAESAFKMLANNQPKTDKKADKKIDNKADKKTHKGSKESENHTDALINQKLSANWQIEKEAVFKRNGMTLKGYIALKYDEKGLETQLYDRESDANNAHLETLVTLALEALKQEIKYLNKQWPNLGKMALMFRSVGNEASLKQDLMKALLQDELMRNELPRSEAALNALILKMKKEIISHANDLTKLVLEILEMNEKVKEALRQLHPNNQKLIDKSIQKALNSLVYVDFISQTPEKWRMEIPRLLKSLIVRIERFSQNIERDNLYEAVLEKHRSQYQTAVEKLGKTDEVIHYYWMILELSVSLFAQPMKTSQPISEKRLDNLWEGLMMLIKNIR